MTKWVAALAIAWSASVGCKGKSEYRDTPETLSKLEDCTTKVSQKDEYIRGLEEKLAMLRTAASDEVLITVQGDALNIRGQGPNRRAQGDGDGGKGTAKDNELYKAFLTGVTRSRGAIKKCYTNALKKDASLQARVITLDITVKYKSSGKVASADFRPVISKAFDHCMGSVTRRWELPAAPRPMTFKAPVTLTPQ